MNELAPPAEIGTVEAARILGVSDSHCSWLARTGILDGRKVGPHWRITAASVREYQERQATNQNMPGALYDAAILETMYREAGGLRNVASQLGVDRKTVRNAMHRMGIAIDNPSQSRLKVVARSQKALPAQTTTRGLTPRQKRWIDVAVIYLKHGLRPPRYTELCPTTCWGRGQCLDGGRCVRAQQEEP